MSAKKKKRVVILGCTGSIGKQTLSIIREFPQDFVVAGLSAHTAEKELSDVAKEFSCEKCTLTSRDGESGLEALIKHSDADIVVNGVSGAAGLKPSIWALESGIDTALANKETIVMAGTLIKKLAKQHNCALLPVDSEHSALFHLIEHFGKENVSSIILTASGGPFRTRSRASFDSITVDDALTHPTWNMGKKITIDSATLANKGLEVIEASFLFDMPVDSIHVVIHPQSMVHSLIETKDGVLYAQISKPDMRHPILNALLYPRFVQNSFEKLDIAHTATELSFSPPRVEDFPMLSLAFDASRQGQAACIAYNAANEIAVDAFIKNKIRFTDFARVTEKVITHFANTTVKSFDDVFVTDSAAREEAKKNIDHIEQNHVLHTKGTL
jgi:1-deoxy-D-xylulose-5-phosphate reductoisomerase